MTGETEDDRTVYAEIMVPLNYLSNFRRNLETPLINCEINLILNWSFIYHLVMQIKQQHMQ